MKKVYTFIILFIVSLFTANAQIEEGHAKFNIQVSSDDPEMESTIAMMQDPNMELYFTKSQTRTTLDLGLFKTTVITNVPKDKAIILTEIMDTKMAVPTTISDITKKGKESEDEFKPTIKFLKDTKKILGYNCKKAIITNDKGINIVYWYTEEIIKLSSEGQDMFSTEIPGFAMEFQSFSDGMTMVFTITEFNKGNNDFEEDIFSTTTPDGFKELTEEELKEMGM